MSSKPNKQPTANPTRKSRTGKPRRVPSRTPFTPRQAQDLTKMMVQGLPMELVVRAARGMRPKHTLKDIQHWVRELANALPANTLTPAAAETADNMSLPKLIDTLHFIFTEFRNRYVIVRGSEGKTPGKDSREELKELHRAATDYARLGVLCGALAQDGGDDGKGIVIQALLPTTALDKPKSRSLEGHFADVETGSGKKPVTGEFVPKGGAAA